MTAIAIRPTPALEEPPDQNDVLRMGSKRLERLRSVLGCLRPPGTHKTVEQLAEELGVSTSSIRRDLRLLDTTGVIVRTRGGARLRLGPTARQVSERTTRELRRVMALKAAGLVPPGPQAVCVIGGAMAIEVVRQLKARVGLTLVTNSLPVAWETARWPGIRPVMLGGRVRPASLSATGEQAEALLDGADLATGIIAADALALEAGVMSQEPAESALASAVAANSRRLVVVLPGPSIGLAAAHHILPLGKVTDLVTDSRAQPDYLDELALAGVTIHIACAHRTEEG